MSQVYIKYWNWYKAVITSRCLPTRMLLVQGWYCLRSYQPCRFLLDTGTGLSIYETNIGPFLCWVWPIWWILRAPIPIVEAPHQTLLDLWCSSLKLPALDGEWGEYLLLTQPDLILRTSLWASTPRWWMGRVLNTYTNRSDFEAQSLRGWIDWGQYISIKKNFGWWLKQLARVTEESFHLMWALGTPSRKCALHTCCRAVSVLG